MSIISMILVVIVAFLAGMEGILDEFEFHQPLVACTLIGLVTGHLTEGIILGGSLQMIALGWANIGAAVAPDAALASVASAIILVQGDQGVKGVGTAIAIAVPLAVAGLFLTMIVRTIAVPIVHIMMRQLKKETIARLKFGKSSLSACKVFVSLFRLQLCWLFLQAPLRVLWKQCLHGCQTACPSAAAWLLP